MSDLQTLFATIDQLTPQEFVQLREYVERRAQTLIFALSSENLKAIDEAMRPVQEDAASMSEEEVKALLEEVIIEVRNERKAARRN